LDLGVSLKEEGCMGTLPSSPKHGCQPVPDLVILYNILEVPIVVSLAGVKGSESMISATGGFLDAATRRDTADHFPRLRA
jgi:hypothetical protein